MTAYTQTRFRLLLFIDCQQLDGLLKRNIIKIKKVLIVGANIPMGAQIAKLLKDEDLDIVVNNIEVKDNMRKSYLETFEDLEPILKFSETKFYDKPKSKFHK